MKEANYIDGIVDEAVSRYSSKNHSSLDPVDDIIGEGDHAEYAILNASVVAILLVCIFIAYMIVSRKLNK